MSGAALQLLSSAEGQIRQERAARSARIDALSVDRTAVLAMSLPRWSPEAEEQEERFAAIRAETTLAERAEVWRVLFARHAGGQRTEA
jgi:hypothetical protein